MAYPKPTPKPGTNVNNRTPKEQTEYDRYEKSKKIGQGDDFTNSPLGKLIGGAMKFAPTNTLDAKKSAKGRAMIALLEKKRLALKNKKK